MVKLVVNIMVIDNLDINCSCTCLITDIIGINIKDSGLVNSIQTFFCVLIYRFYFLNIYILKYYKRQKLNIYIFTK